MLCSAFISFSNLAADMIQEGKITLIDHSGGIEKNIFFISKRLDKKRKKTPETLFFRLKKLSSNNHTYNFLYLAMNNAIPSISGQNNLVYRQFT